VAVLAAIRLYQRFVSPYKGFSCAYRVHTGRCSCSTLGHRAIRRLGVVAGLIVLRERLHRCGDVYRQHRRTTLPAAMFASQRGDCDPGCLPCDGIDLPSGRTLGRCIDGASCLDCGSCDWPLRRDAPRRTQRRRRGT
jgi:putative component of membrane protein insertase Oxa1/YidC/SpoIIIJ protein YidD